MTASTLVSDHTAITLPWPPSTNRYWRRAGTRIHISHEGRAYRGNVLAAVLDQGGPKHGKARLMLAVIAHPPDRRKRDLDNLWKAISDALEFAQVFHDDGQIDDLRIARGEPIKDGQLQVTITPLGGK